MVGHEIWRETLKYVQNEKHSGTGKWRESLKNVKYKKYILCNLDFGEKIEKRGK
jgi:hypothetical protein